MLWWMLLIWLVCVVAAIRAFPSGGESRKGLWLLWLFVVPWAVAVFASPFVLDHHAFSPDGRARLITAQQAALILLGVLSLAAIAYLHRARPFAAWVALANGLVFGMFAILNIAILEPGS